MWIKCSKCGRYKPLYSFYKNSRCVFGILKQCKSCRKVLDKKYINENYKDKQLRDKIYHENNKEHRNAYGRMYRKEHSEVLKEKNKEKYKRYYFNNKDGYSKRTAKRRALKLKQTPKLKQEEKELLTKYYKLSNYLGTNYEVDHTIPLSKGGIHHPDNLQILTREDNRSKGAKLEYTYKHPRIVLEGGQ